MTSLQNALDWIEYNDIINQYWWVGAVLALLIVVACWIIHWIRKWVV